MAATLFQMTAENEERIRRLAHELARDLHPTQEVLQALGYSHEEYEELSGNRFFRQLLLEATAEWRKAGNTQARVKLKAAVGVENKMVDLLNSISDHSEPLSSRVAAFTIVSKLAGLGMPEPPVQADRGQYFKLEIHLDGKDTIVVDGGMKDVTPESYMGRSALFDGMQPEDL